MSYSTILKEGISAVSISLTQVCLQLKRKNISLDKAILSKMQNGKFPPAKDQVNIALAEILGIDQTQLRLAAVKESIPKELIQLIKEAG